MKTRLGPFVSRMLLVGAATLAALVAFDGHARTARADEIALGEKCPSPCDPNLCGGNKGCKCVKYGPNIHACEQKTEIVPVDL